MTSSFHLQKKFLLGYRVSSLKFIKSVFVLKHVRGRFFFVIYLSTFTGKSLSEALIFASTNPQYDDRLLIELQVQYMKIPSSNLERPGCVL